jgi:hypothetical protein
MNGLMTARRRIERSETNGSKGEDLRGQRRSKELGRERLQGQEKGKCGEERREKIP